jgi:hypothetical protein
MGRSTKWRISKTKNFDDPLQYYIGWVEVQVVKQAIFGADISIETRFVRAFDSSGLRDLGVPWVRDPVSHPPSGHPAGWLGPNPQIVHLFSTHLGRPSAGQGHAVEAPSVLTAVL